VKLTGGIHHSGRAYGASDIFVFHSSTVGDGASYGFNASGPCGRRARQYPEYRRYALLGAGIGRDFAVAGAPRTFTVSAQVALSRSCQ
jgi:iron complex outermembrane receptor protein